MTAYKITLRFFVKVYAINSLWMIAAAIWGIISDDINMSDIFYGLLLGPFALLSYLPPFYQILQSLGLVRSLGWFSEPDLLGVGLVAVVAIFTVYFISWLIVRRKNAREITRDN